MRRPHVCTDTWKPGDMSVGAWTHSLALVVAEAEVVVVSMLDLKRAMSSGNPDVVTMAAGSC